jgi:hypothetical protein
VLRDVARSLAAVSQADDGLVPHPIATQAKTTKTADASVQKLFLFNFNLLKR